MSAEAYETTIFKERIKEIVFVIKHNKDYEKAWELMQKYEYSCEQVINSTVKIGLYDLIILIDQNLLQKEL